MDAFVTRAEADQQCGEHQTVCATLLPDGTPKYFLADTDAPDAAVREAAFEIRWGRPMTGVETTALKLAIARAG